MHSEMLFDTFASYLQKLVQAVYTKHRYHGPLPLGRWLALAITDSEATPEDLKYLYTELQEHDTVKYDPGLDSPFEGIPPQEYVYQDEDEAWEEGSCENCMRQLENLLQNIKDHKDD